MTWKSVVIYIALGFIAAGGLLFGGYKWGVWHEREWWRDTDIRDTVTVHDTVTVFPSAAVNPNPAHAKPRPDLTDKRRIDSLTSSNADLMATLASYAETQYVEQVFRTRKDSIEVIGRLNILYFPMDRAVLSDVFVDSLITPEHIITIIKTVETTRIDWGWTAAVALTAVIVIEGILYYFRWKTR